MSSLEDKLKEILGKFENYADHDEYHVESNCPDDWDEDESIKAITQAFIEDGWVKIPQVEVVTRWEAGKKPEVYMVNGREVMTGPEWYAKFEKVMGEAAKSCDGCSCDAMQAARRASGIEEKE